MFRVQSLAYPRLGGTYLVDYLDGVTIKDMTRVFGTPKLGYYEPEKGYDGNEWNFVSTDGRVFNVYHRWGQFRIGAHSDDVADFKEWLLCTLKGAELSSASV